MQLREKSTEGVPGTAAERDSARTSRQQSLSLSLSFCPSVQQGLVQSLLPERRRAALHRAQSSELCGPTASLAWSRLQRQTPLRKAQVSRCLVQLHFFQPGGSSLHPRAPHKHPQGAVPAGRPGDAAPSAGRLLGTGPAGQQLHHRG